MGLLIAGGSSNIANLFTAKSNVADITTMFDSEKIESITEVHNGVLKSWVPGRTVNALSAITEGRQYYFLTTEDLDISEFFESDGGGGSIDFSALSQYDNATAAVADGLGIGDAYIEINEAGGLGPFSLPVKVITQI